MQATPGSISSYSQYIVASKQAVKRKALFSLLAISSVLLALGIIYLNSTSSINNHTVKSFNSSSKVLGVASPNNPQITSNKANGTAISSTNTDEGATKNCTPRSSYLKPTIPSPNSWSNAVNIGKLQTSTYTVYGETPNEIANQIYSCTPVKIGGNKFAASTDYALNWSFRYRSLRDNPKLCKVESAGVGLNMTMVFPSWSPTNKTSPGTEKKWKQFLKNLTDHENEHRDINTKYANIALNKILNLPATDCNNIANVVDNRANAVIDQLNATNKQLDQHTNHGENDGAHL